MAATTENVLGAVRSALQSIPHMDLHACPIALSFADGVLTMEGEVPNIALKKLALERAAAIRGVTGIVDRLRCAPAARMGDVEISNQVRDALLQEPAFADFAIARTLKGQEEVVRTPPATVRGSISLEVEDGVVTLNGYVPGLDDKRLAGVLAWWVPGSRDVINGIVVEPPEEDSDDKIADAVRLVLEKDPLVNASQIRFGVRRSVVTLTGLVPTESEREMAEFDVWYIFGVDGVVNKIQVHP